MSVMEEIQSEFADLDLEVCFDLKGIGWLTAGGCFNLLVLIFFT